ncbi:probable acyl-CoA dehydrogenase 6 isoform X1 [Mobula hypostoma]|uniref:probable acyl-CoA dehydrogenase 6 isoform X1 n=2 Tax=Mobula hypostoma TaxID=723540 RepID=UPI002FC28318
MHSFSAMASCCTRLLMGSRIAAGWLLGPGPRFYSEKVSLKVLSSSPIRDIIYTQDHDSLRESLRKIIEKKINPFVDKWEEEGMFPAHRVFKILGEAGFLGANRPKEYGGLGLDFSYNIAVAEELGNIRCGGIPMAIGVQSDMATPALARFGSEELKRQFLQPTIAGDMVACLGVSEAGAGSDVANIRTKAVKNGDDYIINGGKMWVTNGCQADWMCLLANTSDGPLHKSKSLICLPLKLPGVNVARKIDKLGMRSSDTAEIFFEDVRVPRKYLIGDEGMGFSYQMLQFQEERLWCVASALLPMQNIVQETIEYTRHRKIFGRPVLHNQSVHFRLAELETEIELLRSLLYRCVARYIQGEDVTRLVSMAKLKAGRLIREVTDSCLQFWGGMGFSNELLISRMYRDMRLLSIGGGADEVMLSIICKYMGTLPGRT